ncbi:hypothetical protein [Vibrio europaeus]|uniref:hypothetical protein n=1 Tax=Vibrio europaeus TaxID=300876 RepID=UPI0039E02E6D
MTRTIAIFLLLTLPLNASSTPFIGKLECNFNHKVWGDSIAKFEVTHREVRAWTDSSAGWSRWSIEQLTTSKSSGFFDKGAQITKISVKPEFFKKSDFIMNDSYQYNWYEIKEFTERKFKVIEKSSSFEAETMKETRSEKTDFNCWPVDEFRLIR